MSIIDTPGKIIDVNLDLQQDQTFPDIVLLTNSDFRLLVRPKLDGRWITVTNVTGQLQVSLTIEGNVSSYYDSVEVDNSKHMIAIDVPASATGLPFVGFYSVVLSSDGSDYKMGVGEYNILESEFI